MLLASLQFLPRRSAGRADPRRTEVDGSDPPVFGPGSGAGRSLFSQLRPAPSGGRSRPKVSLREGGRAEPKAGGIAAAGFRLAPQDASVLKQIRAGA